MSLIRDMLLRIGVDQASWGEMHTSLQQGKEELKTFGDTAEEGLGQVKEAVTAMAEAFGAFELAKVVVEWGDAFEQANKTIVAATGAIGDSLEYLDRSFDTVFSAVPQSAGEVAEAIGVIATRLDATGPALEQLSTQILDLARLTGESVQSLSVDTARVFAQWQVPEEARAGVLDFFNQIKEASGASISEIEGNVIQFGATLREFGFSLQDAASMVGDLEKAGIPAEAAMSSLQRAIKSMSKAGISDMVAGLAQLQESIQGAATDAEALQIGMGAFGKSGAVLTEALRQGRVDLTDLQGSLHLTTESIVDQAGRVLTLSDVWEQLWNHLKVDSAPALEFAISGLVRLLEWADKVIEAYKILGAVVSFATGGGAAAPAAFTGSGEAPGAETSALNSAALAVDHYSGEVAKAIPISAEFQKWLDKLTHSGGELKTSLSAVEAESPTYAEAVTSAIVKIKLAAQDATTDFQTALDVYARMKADGTASALAVAGALGELESAAKKAGISQTQLADDIVTARAAQEGANTVIVNGKLVLLDQAAATGEAARQVQVFSANWDDTTGIANTADQSITVLTGSVTDQASAVGDLKDHWVFMDDAWTSMVDLLKTVASGIEDVTSAAEDASNALSDAASSASDFGSSSSSFGGVAGTSKGNTADFLLAGSPSSMFAQNFPGGVGTGGGFSTIPTGIYFDPASQSWQGFGDPNYHYSRQAIIPGSPADIAAKAAKGESPSGAAANVTQVVQSSPATEGAVQAMEREISGQIIPLLEQISNTLTSIANANSFSVAASGGTGGTGNLSAAASAAAGATGQLGASAAQAANKLPLFASSISDLGQGLSDLGTQLYGLGFGVAAAARALNQLGSFGAITPFGNLSSPFSSTDAPHWDPVTGQWINPGLSSSPGAALGAFSLTPGGLRPPALPGPQLPATFSAVPPPPSPNYPAATSAAGLTVILTGNTISSLQAGQQLAALLVDTLRNQARLTL
ncbi:MAG: hypothetical protein EPO08_20695 [Rhodospirillaceae bacterium]|nr:MAG: hypothetical protein EPO08_20695 [Rhodospirillaceae bacterium]